MSTYNIDHHRLQETGELAFKGTALPSIDGGSVSGDATAGSVTITTAFGTVDGHIVQIIDTNGDVVTQDAAVSASGSDITVGDGPTNYTMADTDTVYWIAWGS